jgi:8-oxo-dGTP pyrophosphatase MutT (NUDIX family)
MARQLEHVAVNLIARLPGTGRFLGVTRKDNHEDWGLPGGKVEPGDRTYQEALAREVLEETGLELDMASLREVYHEEHNGKTDITYVGTVRGTVNFDEPHLVGPVRLEVLCLSPSFGAYNVQAFKQAEEVEYPLSDDVVFP